MDRPLIPKDSPLGRVLFGALSLGWIVILVVVIRGSIGSEKALSANAPLLLGPTRIALHDNHPPVLPVSCARALGEPHTLR